jgi:hypothetical protein
MKQTIINEYQAAALVAMSPTLLRSFTSYAAKYDDTRKLLVAYKKDDSFFFDKEEINGCDSHGNLALQKHVLVFPPTLRMRSR